MLLPGCAGRACILTRLRSGPAGERPVLPGIPLQGRVRRRLRRYARQAVGPRRGKSQRLWGVTGAFFRPIKGGGLEPPLRHRPSKRPPSPTKGFCRYAACGRMAALPGGFRRGSATAEAIRKRRSRRFAAKRLVPARRREHLIRPTSGGRQRPDGPGWETWTQGVSTAIAAGAYQ